MSKAKKRTRILADKSAAVKITIRPYSYEKNGTFYTSYLVQGWKENGKWKKREFKDEEKAKTFAALKEIEGKNQGRAVRMVTTSMSDDQVKQAETAFDLLGTTYTLDAAVQFFLANHRPPEFKTTISEGMKHYLDDKERDGMRARSLRGTKGVIAAFHKANGDPQVHKVTRQMIEAHLRALRAEDGVSPAKRKSWNTHLNEISQFFDWAMQEDLSTNRPWCFANPVKQVKKFTAQQVAEQRPEKSTTAPSDLRRMFTFLMRYRGGQFVKTFALAYFAGIRPSKEDSELTKLAEHEDDFINLRTGQIFIPAKFSKTKHDRQITITDNLRAWLEAYRDFPIIPKNYGTPLSKIRTHFDLKRDETRHSFISYHVALHRSIGDAALQAGNSESMVKNHYLNLHTKEEGEAFFAIVPDLKTRRAISSTEITHPALGTLKAV
jgi:site-specific recombinase XerD